MRRVSDRVVDVFAVVDALQAGSNAARARPGRSRVSQCLRWQPKQRVECIMDALLRATLNCSQKLFQHACKGPGPLVAYNERHALARPGGVVGLLLLHSWTVGMREGLVRGFVSGRKGGRGRRGLLYTRGWLRSRGLRGEWGRRLWHRWCLPSGLAPVASGDG